MRSVNINILLGFLLLINVNTYSQQIDTAAIKNQLRSIHERDQKTRTKGDSVSFMNFIDSCNLAQVELIIQKYGWLGKSIIGENANGTIWLVIQHAELPAQEKYLPLLTESVAKGESNPIHLAMLQDRILMRKNRPQIYGSQVVFDENGQPRFHPIADEKNVNSRRIAIGMESIEDYAQHFGIEYHPPK